MVLSVCIVVYLFLTVLLGLYTSRWVQSSRDYALASRRLGLMLSSTSLFATWFGSETLLGATTEYARSGFLGIIEEPLGCVLALVLIAFFFARPWYKLNLLTFGDFFRIHYGKRVEFYSSLIMVLTYFGWVAAQLLALAFMGQVLLGLSFTFSILMGASVVLVYTFFGGMWALSITDFIQTIVIVLGLGFLLYQISNDSGGILNVLSQTPPKYFQILPNRDWFSIAQYVAAWLTLGFGAIPSQDVFQRIMSAKSEKIAFQTCLVSALMYLLIILMPLMITLCIRVQYPQFLRSDIQNLLLNTVINTSPLVVQVLFFGALLSAVLSTASGAILAPSTVLAENIIKPLFKIEKDHQLLLAMRCSVALITVLSTVLAFLSQDILRLAAVASALGAVSLFVPVFAGIYLKSLNTPLGAALAMMGGLVSFLLLKWLDYQTFPILLVGLGISLIGFFIGAFLSKWMPELNAVGD